MSTSKKIVAVYENLPSGGAKLTYQNTSSYLKNFFIVKTITEPKYRISNLAQYLYVCFITSQRYQRNIIKKTKHDILLVYHSWMVKTPSVLRYTNSPKIYFCHEPMREYYDSRHRNLQSIKEKIINLLRLPIMLLDRINIRAKNTTIVANSNYSKRIIDKVYSVNSEVIYPGINTEEYQINQHVSKNHQVICVSAINKYKNQIFLIEVIARVPHKLRPTLILIGNGADRTYLNILNDRARVLGVKIRVKLNVTHKEKLWELEKSKIFMYSPIAEPFGIVMEEALATGLPILTYNNGGGYNEIISSKNGTILNTLDPEIWSTNLQDMLLDSRTLRDISEYNSSYARKYLDSRKTNKEILKLINNYI